MVIEYNIMVLRCPVRTEEMQHSSPASLLAHNHESSEGADKIIKGCTRKHTIDVSKGLDEKSVR